MHDISDNKYLNDKFVHISEYTLENFLCDECMYEKKTDTETIVFAISNILSLLHCDFRLLGYEFLTVLTTYYIIKKDFTVNIATKAIADACGSEPKVVTDNIIAMLDSDPYFISTAMQLLGKHIGIEAPTIADAVEIAGAVFKKYYNYATDCDELAYEANPAINFITMEFTDGTKRKKS